MECGSFGSLAKTIGQLSKSASNRLDTHICSRTETERLYLAAYPHFKKVVNFRLMPRRPTYVAAASFVLVCGCASVPGFAQLVASRDLTSGWRVPSEHIAVPETCDNPRSSVIEDDQAKAD